MRITKNGLCYEFSSTALLFLLVAGGGYLVYLNHQTLFSFFSEKEDEKKEVIPNSPPPEQLEEKSRVTIPVIEITASTLSSISHCPAQSTVNSPCKKTEVNEPFSYTALATKLEDLKIELGDQGAQLPKNESSFTIVNTPSPTSPGSPPPSQTTFSELVIDETSRFFRRNFSNEEKPTTSNRESSLFTKIFGS